MPKMTEANLRDWLETYIAEHLSEPRDRIDFTADFDALGLDSADAVIAGGFLEEHFDIEIDATLFMRNQTIDALVTDMARQHLLED